MKRQTNISVKDNLGIKVTSNMIIGDSNNGYKSGDILDANATKQIAADIIGSAPELLDTLGEVATALESKQDVIEDLSTIRSGASAGATALQPADITSLELAVQTIDGKIPSQADSSNQLADKAFVNSSVSTNTADFKGTYDYVDDLDENIDNLPAAIQDSQYSAPNNNDYCFVITVDENGNTLYERYKYNGTVWNFEYALNNSSFTSAQWAAINSNITAALTAKLQGINAEYLVESPNIRTIVTLTQAQYDALTTKDVNTEYNIIESV